jgi:hypothetical protein
MFLRNVTWLQADYTASYPQNSSPHNYRYENLKSYAVSTMYMERAVFFSFKE